MEFQKHRVVLVIDYARFAHGVQCALYDSKTAGVERARLERRCKVLGWEVLLNRAGTTFRKLAERDKQVDGSDAAIALMLAQPSMIKRPVPERDGDRRVGGKPEIDQRSFQRPAANRR